MLHAAASKPKECMYVRMCMLLLNALLHDFSETLYSVGTPSAIMCIIFS